MKFYVFYESTSFWRATVEAEDAASARAAWGRGDTIDDYEVDDGDDHFIEAKPVPS